MAKLKAISPSDVGAREKLLTAAAELFSRKGYSATTTREIVTSAEVTKPVLYYYFKSKEGIYLELMKRATAPFEEMVNTVRNKPGSPGKRLLRFCDQIFSLFMEHLEVARLMYSIYYGPPQGAPFFDFEALHLKMRETITELLEEGIRAGDFQDRNVQDMTWAILGAVNIAMEAELCHPERGVGCQGIGRVLNVIFQGMGHHGCVTQEPE